MKGVLSRTLAMVFLSIAFTVNAFAGWHDESQATRNQQIVTQANHDLTLNGYPGCQTQACLTTGGACKPWATDVVRVASNLAGGLGVIPVYLPPTAEGGNAYYWDLSTQEQANKVYSYGALAPNAMVPGMIIQMRVHFANGSYGPHTAIVFSTSPATSQLTLVESNYQGDYKVKTRTVSYLWFGSPYIESGNHYTAYMIR